MGGLARWAGKDHSRRFADLAEPSSQAPVFPPSPLQLEVGPQDQGGPMVPRALKMQHPPPDPPLKAGDLDFYVPLLPTRYLLGLVPNRLDV